MRCSTKRCSCSEGRQPLTESGRQAIFAGLIQNEEGEPVEVAHLGDEAFYVIPEGEFRRHVEASKVDEQVLRMLREQFEGMEDQIAAGVMQFLGKEDLFTKASIDMALKNFDQAFRKADPEQWKPWLGMLGFRVIVNVHGEVVRIESPEQEIDEE
jgi:PHD/YefM family antitoxin component YafN of YafNO toxin-antitoxin module